MRRASSVEKLTMPAPDLTAEQAREMLSYDPKTGILRWKVERYRKHAIARNEASKKYHGNFGKMQ